MSELAEKFSDRKIAFVEHPVSRSEKVALNRDGFRVLDIRFKPAELRKGDKIVERPKPKAEEKPKA
jgi:hypothetical protein